MKMFKQSIRAAALTSCCAFLLPALAGCTIMDALDKRANARNQPALTEATPTVVETTPSSIPQDQRVTLYVLGVDGVD